MRASNKPARLPALPEKRLGNPAIMRQTRASLESGSSVNQVPVRKDPCPTMARRKNPSQIRVHSFKRPILCRGIGCKTEFIPIRRDQGFCSPACKSKYFAIARKLGMILMENHGIELHRMECEQEAYEVKCNGQILRFNVRTGQ